jgi:hypothetical protein
MGRTQRLNGLQFWVPASMEQEDVKFILCC